MYSKNADNQRSLNELLRDRGYFRVVGNNWQCEMIILYSVLRCSLPLEDTQRVLGMLTALYERKFGKLAPEKD